MSMRYEKIKDCAEDLQMREINDSLDPEIESEISRREEEEGDITALLARLEQGEVRKDDEQNKTAPTVIEFIIDRESNVLPMVPGGNALSEMVTEFKKEGK